VVFSAFEVVLQRGDVPFWAIGEPIGVGGLINRENPRGQTRRRHPNLNKEIKCLSKQELRRIICLRVNETILMFWFVRTMLRSTFLLLKR